MLEGGDGLVSTAAASVLVTRVGLAGVDATSMGVGDGGDGKRRSSGVGSTVGRIEGPLLAGEAGELHAKPATKMTVNNKIPASFIPISNHRLPLQFVPSGCVIKARLLMRSMRVG